MKRRDHSFPWARALGAWALGLVTLLAAPAWAQVPDCGNGVVETGEACDQGADNGASSSCCDAGCQLVPADTLCRSGSGDLCDPAETCDGSSPTCPLDVVVGGLVGVIGDGGSPSETLFRVSTSDASTALIQALGNGSSGESIAFNPTDGLLYHWSGFFTDQIMETIDLVTGVVTPVVTDFVPYDPQEVRGSTYDPTSGNFLLTDNRSNLSSVTPAGVFAVIGPLPASIRGVAFNGGKLYGAVRFGDALHELDPATGGSLSSVAVSLAGFDVFGLRGLATEPNTGTLYGILQTDGGRRLASIDPVSGTATDIGQLPNGFANIAFGGGVCRQGSGDLCDADELCTGVAGATCPADDAPGNTGLVCRPVADDCDVADTCTGNPGDSCPADAVEAAGVECRASLGDCDPGPEFCDGQAASCPENVLAPVGTVCRPAAGTCDAPETCLGVPGCPFDLKRPAGFECRAPAGLCDAAEICDGSSDACPADLKQPAATVCRAAEDSCDAEELCDGSSDACPADVAAAAGTVCRAGSGDVCDPEEVCDGSSMSCPEDVVLDAGVVCNPGTGDLCDPAETCSGIAGEACPADSFVFPSGVQLFGVSGNGAPQNPKSLFLIDTGDASTVYTQAFGSGDSGESIALNTDDGLLYHWSGAANLVMESFDVDTRVLTDVPLNLFLYDPFQVLGSTYDASSGVFLVSDLQRNLARVTTTGIFSLVGPLPPITRGLAFQGGTLYGAALTDDTLYELNPADASVISSRSVSLAGFTVHGMTGLATHPDTGVLYAIVKTQPQGNGGRRLVTVDPSTSPATATDVGPLPAGFANIDFAAAAAVVCRAGSGDVCDAEELCPGGPDVACAADVIQPAGFVCDPGSGDLCDPAETCSGVNGEACPADQIAEAGTPCRGVAGSCDVAESCSGVADEACPADAFVAAGTSCRTGSGDDCDPDEACTGSSASCPADVVQGTDHVCNAGSGDVCDPDETCPGTPGDACPSDVVLPAGSVCRPGGDPSCDPAEVCDGQAGSPCPGDVSSPNGTSCDDGDVCTLDDACFEGQCSTANPVVLDVSKLCQVFTLDGPTAMPWPNCDILEPPQPPHCEGKILELALLYLGGGCTVSNDQDGKATCSGDDPEPGPVSITVTKDPTKFDVSPSSGIRVGDLVTVTSGPDDGNGELDSELELDVSGAGGTQSLEIHTSCSKPLDLGDRFGVFDVVGLRSKDGSLAQDGARVEYTYLVGNPNSVAVTNVSLDDDVLGPIDSGITIPASGNEERTRSSYLREDVINTVTVTGEIEGEQCSVDTAQANVEIVPRPPEPRTKGKKKVKAKKKAKKVKKQKK